MRHVHSSILPTLFQSTMEAWYPNGPFKLASIHFGKTVTCDNKDLLAFIRQEQLNKVYALNECNQILIATCDRLAKVHTSSIIHTICDAGICDWLVTHCCPGQRISVAWAVQLYFWACLSTTRWHIVQHWIPHLLTHGFHLYVMERHPP